MYVKPMLSLDRVQRAISTMLSKANGEPDRPLAVATVDGGGDPASYARMDRWGPPESLS